MRLALIALALCACGPRPPALHADPEALAFRSRQRVADADARIIAAEAIGEAKRRPAWNEPAHVHAADGPFGDGRAKYLFGEARLVLGEYETTPGAFREVDRGDDALMAYGEALHLVGQLRSWSQRFHIAWDVQLGAVRGRVEADRTDGGTDRILATLAKHAGGATPAAAEAARSALDAKYRDRR